MEPFDTDDMIATSRKLDALEREQERRGFWWHWQSLKKDWPKAWLHGRAWLHKRPRNSILGVEWVIPTRSFGIGFDVGGDENQLSVHLSCRLFSLHLHFERWTWLDKWKAAKSYHGKRTDIGIHHWALWWHVWTDEHEWHSKTPKWRDGAFHIDDFFLGKANYSKVDQEPIPAVVSMPEGDYPVTITFFQQTWKRPRWPIAKRRNGAEVESEQGIPIPGKGENSWDCGDDAYHGIGTSATTVEGAIAHAIETVNKRRERYGGKNWLPPAQPITNNH